MCHSKLLISDKQSVDNRNLIECAMTMGQVYFNTKSEYFWVSSLKNKIWHSNMTFRIPWSYKPSEQIEEINNLDLP